MGPLHDITLSSNKLGLGLCHGWVITEKKYRTSFNNVYFIQRIESKSAIMFICRLSIPTIVAQFVAIFAISTFIGLSLLHLSLIWRRIQVGTSSRMIPKRFDVLMYSRKVFNYLAIVVALHKF